MSRKFITTKKEVYALADTVNAKLAELNRANRIHADERNGMIHIEIGTAEQIDRGCAEKSLGGFSQPRQAEQYLNGFLEGLQQPTAMVNKNGKVTCAVCNWWGVLHHLKEVKVGGKNPTTILVCPNCDSHNLIGI